MYKQTKTKHKNRSPYVKITAIRSLPSINNPYDLEFDLFDEIVEIVYELNNPITLEIYAYCQDK